MAFLEPSDLDAFAEIDEIKAQQMIDDATAMAVLVAPCLEDEGELSEHQIAATKAILRAAILRWNEAGSGAVVQQSAGPFQQTMDNRQARRAMFWPSEIDSLVAICRAGQGTGGAFSIDTAPSTGIVHADVCSVNFGATYCSCGAILTGGWPLYES